ncbi:MAG: chorismate-binding protein [Crocinitomicaceae bacterium]|nr:chorismate-binding protein [Crocinitomicaceae bacterium]
MHRKINRIGCCIKSKQIEAFFAYRIPDAAQPKFFKGDFVKLEQPVILEKDEIIIHSFLGDEIYVLKNPQEINSEKFQLLDEETFDDLVVADQNTYLEAFAKMKNVLDDGTLKKIILSRIKKVITQKNGLEIFNLLNVTYKSTFNYIFSSAETGVWIGATPELLLKADDHLVSTVSLAGTKPNDGFSEWTQKEREEQKIVTDFILTAFQENKIGETISSKTYTAKAGPVEHLKTDIHGKIETENQIYSLLKSLHPTPATCGIPKVEAKAKIVQVEKHQRKFYTGFIGINSDEIKYYFVNLRCMKLQKNNAYLYVGGGLTSASVAEREWAETERKADTLEKVLK